MMDGQKPWDFDVIDVDSHVYEPEAIWDRYLPGGYEAVGRSAFWHGLDDRGNSVTILNGVVAQELNRTKIVRQAIWRPGMSPEDIGRLDPTVHHSLNPGANNPEARLADLDQLGVAQQVIFPTLFAEYFPLVENPDAAAALARAYNDWVFDFCAADRTRLHPAAVLPLQSLLFAHRELDRVAEKGFRAVFLRPMFYRGAITEDRSAWGKLERVNEQVASRMIPFMSSGTPAAFIDHPHFQTLWHRIEELGLVACVHPSVGSTNPEGTSEGSFIERVAKNLNIGHSVAESVAYLQDSAIFLICACFHGLLEDFPNLRLALLHSGATMVPLTLEKAETYLWIVSPVGGTVPPTKPVSLEPRGVFERHPVVVSFDSWETPVVRMSDDLFLEKAAWGSRYPHHDASAPAEAISSLEEHGNDEKVIKRLLGGNAAELFGLRASAVV
jgi:predicted TIM-barrel fold metal-dependent hydrolase